MNHLHSTGDFQSIVNRYKPESRGEIIKDLSKDPLNLIALFKYASKNQWDISDIKEIFNKIIELDNEKKLNEEQIRGVIKIASKIYPAQKEDSLKIISSEFLVKHLNEENVYTYLEYAKKKKADGHIQKCLDFIQNQAGIKFVTADSLLSIEITEPKIPLEEVSKQITALIKIYEGNVAITFKPKISGNMEAFKGFIEQQGPFIQSLDLRELGDSVDDDAMEKWIKSCPNLKSVIIRSNNITGRGLEELGSLANLTTLDLSGCKSLTKLPSKLPANLTTLKLSGCTSLTKLPEELPANLTTLDLLYCRRLTKLPSKLPAGLTTLKLSGCTSLTKLPEELPANLTTLKLSGCTSLTKLPEELPANLTTLKLSGCTSLTKLPKLPATLKKLYLSFCKRLTELPEELPANLTTLDLSYCTSLTKLPVLPASLTTLDLSGCERLTELPALPATLTTLNLSGCRSLTKLPVLPASLTTLDLSGCERLTELPALPATLTTLNLSGCRSLTKLPVLPASLTTLDFSGCERLTELPALPATLTTLNLSGCTSLRKLPKLPVTLIALGLAWCTSLTKLPKLPDTLTTLILFGCRSLTELPSNLPATLITLELSGCEGLTELPSNLPATLTMLYLSGCTSLTKLPKLPATLTRLELSGCRSLTDESRLNALSSLLEANLEQGFKLIKNFEIRNQDSLFKLLGEKLNGEPIVEGQDYRVVLAGALEKKLSDQTISPSTLMTLAQFIYDNQVSLHLHDEHPLMQEAIAGALEKKLSDQTIPPSMLMALAQFIYDNQESLHLHDEHPLMQEAIGIISIASVEGAKNPFSLFKRLTELFQKPSDFNPPAMDVEGVLVAINRAQLMAMEWGKIKREDLSQNVTRKAFDYLTTALREKVRANGQKAQEALADLSITWETIETPIFGDPTHHLAGMLDLAGENVSDIEAKWRAVLSNIFDKNHAEREGHFFTEREETFILTIMGIQNCQGGKDAGIALSYEQLDPEYRYQNILSKPMSIAEIDSEEKRGAAIRLVKEFESSALEKLNMESPKQASEAEKLASFLNQNFKDNSIVLTPIFDYRVDCWNWDENSNPISVSEKGALTLLELVKKEDLNPVVEQTIQKLIAAQFSGTNLLMQELTGEREIAEGAHQAIYLKNLIGHLVGVSGGVAFDRHTGVLYDGLIAKDREEVLRIFFKHVTPKSFVDEIVRVVNSQQIKFGTLSHQGAIDLLKQLHYLS